MRRENRNGDGMKIERELLIRLLRDLIKDVIDNKSSIFRISGITLVIEDFFEIEEKDIKTVGTGFHSMVPSAIGLNFDTVFLVPGKKKIEEVKE